MDPFVEIILSEFENKPGEALPPRGERKQISPAVSVVVRDEGQRARFKKMRELAHYHSDPRLDYNAVYYNNDQRAVLSEIFVRQARFMEDFTDDFERFVPFSSYYPVYQMMSCEQLRTYFTWRAKVREALNAPEIEVPPATASYAFLYVYELLNQIGTGGRERGLAMLLDFSEAFRRHDTVLDKHVTQWIKDYHIYFNIPYSGIGGRFDFYSKISGHVSGGVFCTGGNGEMMREAVICAVDRLSNELAAAGADFNALLFPLSPPKLAWKPFAHALFVPEAGRPDSITVLSSEEIYICRRQNWTCRAVKHGNRRLMGYIFKKTEECLRRLTRFKRAIAADLSAVDRDTLRTLQAYGIYLDKLIEKTAEEYYAGKNKIEVNVDIAALVKIREEALEIQEKLTVEEKSGGPKAEPDTAGIYGDEFDKAQFDLNADDGIPEDTPPLFGPWEIFYRSLTVWETEALRIILDGEDLKAFADSRGVMAEVLTDGINQKAFDAVGDNIMEYDGRAEIYEDYTEALRGVCLI